MIKKLTLSASLVVLLGFTTSGQDMLSTIERAMMDEMERNMTQLRSDKYSDPFFIRYRIIDQQNITVSASLGALHNSSEEPFRTKDIRVMVGDYEFNDESLDGDGMELDGKYPYGYADFTMPLGDDYYGIRRSLWITTDAIYKIAGQYYKDFLNDLEKDGKTYEDIDHKRFAKVPVVEYMEPVLKQPFSRKKLEDFVREASTLFVEYPDLLISSVRANSNVSTEYFLNSEGTRYRTSTLFANIDFTVSMINSEGEMSYETHNHELAPEDSLPSMEEVQKIVTGLVGKMLAKDSAERFVDSYYGPVLFEDETVSRLFSSYLINQLYASTQLESEGYYGGYNGGSHAMDDRIGQRVISKELSVTLLPTLTEWGGAALSGSYRIDSEGVMPADTLVLIENGILKNLMTSRTLTKETQVANGTGSGPGVALISTSEGSTKEALRQRLLELARKYDQEYAIIIREANEYGGLYDLSVVKVHVETGEEEVLRGANITDLGINNLKRILGISSSLMVENHGRTSYITPDALLLEDVGLSGRYNPQPKMKEALVKSPLVKSSIPEK
ncbi:MAG: metallopeptidase TldD-related protein [Ekhidna sp.]|uniref:metallopeptidase TldD-related protein n=1 Tax=Ekhidna sp. TaxID=2608089 RepID=UPI0032EB34D6